MQVPDPVIASIINYFQEKPEVRLFTALLQVQQAANRPIMVEPKEEEKEDAEPRSSNSG